MAIHAGLHAHPRVLVERLDDVAILGQAEAEPVPEHDLRLCEVREHLPGGPLARRVAPLECLRRPRADQPIARCPLQIFTGPPGPVVRVCVVLITSAIRLHSIGCLRRTALFRLWVPYGLLAGDGAHLVSPTMTRTARAAKSCGSRRRWTDRLVVQNRLGLRTSSFWRGRGAFAAATNSTTGVQALRSGLQPTNAPPHPGNRPRQDYSRRPRGGARRSTR